MTTNSNEITPNELAREYGVDPKALRAKLRKAFPHHTKHSRWTALIGSADHRVWIGLAVEVRGH